MDDLIVKFGNINITKELESIGFDSSYINKASLKYSGNLYKIFNVKTYEANILKQICLSLGFDCAVSRNTVTCEDEYTNCLIFATASQIDKLTQKLEKQPFRFKKISKFINDIRYNKLTPLKIRAIEFDWSHPYFMGILNITPDSFSDGGEYTDIKSIMCKVEQLIEDGADIIDIGGESTNLDSKTISIKEEINRVIPILKEIRRKNINIPISIDTRNYETAKESILNGADIINDVSGLNYDAELYNYIAKNNIPVIIMHSDRVPANPNDYTQNDIIEDVYFELFKKIDKLIKDGHDKSNIIADIGIGFGKSKDTNFELLKRINEFKSLNVPLGIGISRKSFIRNEFNIGISESDIPTALYSAMLPQINIHRVHNVKLAKQYQSFAKKLF